MLQGLCILVLCLSITAAIDCRRSRKIVEPFYLHHFTVFERTLLLNPAGSPQLSGDNYPWHDE